MDMYRYLIVGGGAAGISAAETIRGRDATGSIAVVNDEPYFLYSRVMLSKPNFFLGRIPLDQVFLKPPEWFEKGNIKYLAGKRAANLDFQKRIATLSDGTAVGFEKLLLATGSCVRRWGIPGADKKGIHYLRTLDDGKSIMEDIKTKKHAVTVGGGFIGFEMADMCRMAGLDVTMLLREPYFWDPILDEPSGSMIEEALTKGGVKILKNAEAQEVIGGESVEGLVLKNGEQLACDMVICGIGTTCEMGELAAAGLAVNRGILANEYLETNIPNVWTAGDVAEYQDVLLEERVQMGNWVNASEQGKTAGLNMTGAHEPFRFVSFYTTQGFGITIAFVGDVRPGADRVVIPRGSKELNSYARIVIVGKELVGATMINRTKELTAIARLIDHNVDVSQKQKELADPDFDLKTLV